MGRPVAFNFNKHFKTLICMSFRISISEIRPHNSQISSNLQLTPLFNIVFLITDAQAHVFNFISQIYKICDSIFFAHYENP